MKSLKEKIEVMQAALDEKEIEKCLDGKWNTVIRDPQNIIFNWTYDYRIKQEPMELMIDVYCKECNGWDRYEVASDSNRRRYRKPDKTIKMREVTE